MNLVISNLKEILYNWKFKRGTKGEVDDALQKGKYENIVRIDYLKRKS